MSYLAASLERVSVVEEKPSYLDGFSAASQAWFSTTFQQPTKPQLEGWPQIARGKNTLILAPTGSGKTLTAFFWGLNRLTSEPPPENKNKRTRILYISPLRALAVDVEKNLRAPLKGVGLAAERLGEEYYEPTVGIRTGDTSPKERRQLATNPPDLLITTPESLYLMLTSQVAETLAGVETVIIDEIHALAATKRGAHLSVSLERLERITDKPLQRIGLSATQRPLSEIAAYLGGFDTSESPPKRREVAIVDTGIAKELDIQVQVPIEDMGALGERVYPEEGDEGDDQPGPVRRSIWPSMHPEILELIKQHTSTIIFVNSRRLAERLSTRLNELYFESVNLADEQVGTSTPAGQELVMAHHGSLSRVQRLQIEDRLKRGELKGLVATSSLELGIDMGAVDLVIQVESPGAVSRGLQRVGRAGHQVGAPSVGKFFPKHRADLLESAVVVNRMKQGLIEATSYPRNPIDVLAQQLVAMCALQEWTLDDLKACVRASANFKDLSDELFDSVLDLLTGRYPSDEFSELRPRLIWDRVAGTISGRPGAQRLAVTSGGTIPDRGLYGVFLPDGTRVGELDEEMVYESRVGETFLLGASTWRIEDITHERVVVVPAPGAPGKMPFWHGDGPGRPYELGRSIGELTRQIDDDVAKSKSVALNDISELDDLARANLVSFVAEQREFSGLVPNDKTIVVERFRDEIGDWRIVILSPFGARVHAPWGMALQHMFAQRLDMDFELQWADDGIIMRLPEAINELPLDDLALDIDELDDILASALPNSAMFAARFRECAARALLLPKLRPDKRTPLWQQRQKAANLLQVAAKYPKFPVLLETTRECLNDVFDVPALKEVLGQIHSRAIKIVPVDTSGSSPFAQSLMFGWVAQYMYEGDAPLAERRAAALSLDKELLRDLLGAEQLRELLDPEVLEALEAELSRRADGWKAKSVDHVEELFRWLGPLDAGEVATRVVDGLDVASALETLVEQRRIIQVSYAGRDCYASAQDAARLRDALGVALPAGLPAAFCEPVPKPFEDLVSRYARTHGPFQVEELASAIGSTHERCLHALEDLERDGRVTQGEFRPDGKGKEFCSTDVLATLRRRSLAALRKEVEPVSQSTLAKFLPVWQHVGSKLRGVDGLSEVITNLQGAALPASVLEQDILRSRVEGYRPADLDTLLTSGEVVWVGASSIGSDNGRVRLLWRDSTELLELVDPDSLELDATCIAIVKYLEANGACFWADIQTAVKDSQQNYSESAVLRSLWDLVWQGVVTNDSFTPVRALNTQGISKKPKRSASRRGRYRQSGLRSLSRSGPPSATGRWTLTKSLKQAGIPETITLTARANQLLERYGILTAEMALAEGTKGGFAGVYRVLKELENRGQVRRGYFVEGLGAAQFALPGAVDRLRDFRPQLGQEDELDETKVGSPVLLAATDPAQPYGAAIEWPKGVGRLSRSAGAYVILEKGELAAFLDRGGKNLVVIDTSEGASTSWIDELLQLVKQRRVQQLEIQQINSEALSESPAIKQALLAAGFAPGYKGLTYRGSGYS